ncbi:MAG: DUF4339 domain-containing protein [Bacteroides sp.]|nr:DUF4339 domain-containing protein [Bacteroides sp.]
MAFLKDLANQFVDTDSIKSKVFGTSAPSSSINLGSTPPPPPVPSMGKPLRVMVAINGQQYGPYEKATLTSMINDGQLTKDTYVYMEGMSSWRFAREVPEVNALFGSPAMPFPPEPFAPAVPGSVPSVPGTSNTGRDGLSAKMNSLIDAAVADGEITDLERQVLIRNAQAEGVAMDEFVVILEARLFEQRRRMQAEAAQQKHVATAATTVHTAVSQPKKNEVRKCPACGQVIFEASAFKCSACGYEFDGRQNGGATAGSTSSIKDLQAKLHELDREHDSMNILSRTFGERDYIARKKQVIAAYPIPTRKDDIIDFFLACRNLSKGGMQDPTAKAWHRKMEEVAEKARLTMSSDQETMSLIDKYCPEKKKRFGLF